MNRDQVVAVIRSGHDQELASLRDVCSKLRGETLLKVLAALRERWSDPGEDTAERLAAHAAIVGLKSAMLSVLDDET